MEIWIGGEDGVYWISVMNFIGNNRVGDYLSFFLHIPCPRFHSKLSLVNWDLLWQCWILHHFLFEPVHAVASNSSLIYDEDLLTMRSSLKQTCLRAMKSGWGHQCAFGAIQSCQGAKRLAHLRIHHLAKWGHVLDKFLRLGLQRWI